MHATLKTTTPLHRASIGFDNLLDRIERQMTAGQTSYPPYNIEKRGDYEYRLTIAIAGFAPEEIDIEVQKNHISVRSLKEDTEQEDGSKNYLHQGIAKRAFHRQFSIAENVNVKDAYVENGLLHIDMEKQVPEEQKPVKIQIRKTELN